MTKVFSNKSSIYCIIRQQNFNKLVLKNCLTLTEDCEQTKEEFELIFSPNQVYSIRESVIYCHIFLFYKYVPHGKF